MSITKELREWAKTKCFEWRANEILAVADRIDAEHEKQVTDAFTKGAIDGIDMAEHSIEYVKLPVDADGVPIHVGDVLNPPAGCEDYVPMLVMRLTYDGYENEWFFDGEAGGFCGMVGKHMDVAGWTHHHAPTVEDVLREFYSRYCITKPKKEDDAIIAEYAAKLRLAGDDE